MINSKLELQKKNFNQFKKQLEYIYNNNKIYRKKMQDSNVKIPDIKEISDISKLPLTNKKDFFINYPSGFYATDKKIVRYHASSGTTGKSLIVGFTVNDLKLRNQMIIDVCSRIGITRDDVVQICYGYGMFTGGLGFHEALEEYGCTIVPTSSGNTEKQIFYMQQLKTTVLMTSPSYAMHIYEVAKDIGVDLKKLSVRILKLGSELLSTGMRKKLKEAWGDDIIISQDYGMTETMGPGFGSECKYNNMHIYDKNFIYELVEPVTKEPVNSNIGELVISNLYNECFPIIRYATNDIVELKYEKCTCGCDSAIIKRIIGRCDDMIKVKGVKIYLSQVEEFILSHQYCTANYEIILSKEDFIDEIEIQIEYYRYLDLSDKKNILKKIQLEGLLMDKFKSQFGIKANIKLVKKGSIKRSTGKVKHIKRINYWNNRVQI